MVQGPSAMAMKRDALVGIELGVDLFHLRQQGLLESFLRDRRRGFPSRFLRE